jgi:hypothetical protein
VWLCVWLCVSVCGGGGEQNFAYQYEYKQFGSLACYDSREDDI